MKEIGEYLKETRINNGVSIDEAAEDLNISAIQLENMEEGNVRAFKDVFSLRDLVKTYSKYLGLDSENIMDEFNDFLFEHTSKISLEDIKEARQMKIEKEQEEKEKKIASPYTKIKRQKIKTLPILIGLLVVAIIALIVYIVIICIDNNDSINTELCSKVEVMEEYNEFTY